MCPTHVRAALVALQAALLVAACGESDECDRALLVETDFAQGAAGWQADTADFTPQTAPDDVVVDVRALPAPFAGFGLHVAGTNRSDDLFIYHRYRVSGLEPGSEYRAAIRVEFLTDAPSGCTGVGGSPGESVWIVAGVVGHEPATVFDGESFRVDVDRGNQSASGRDGLVLGDIANSVPDCGPRRFEVKQLATPNPSPLKVEADDRGEAWIFFGVDSGYEGRSAVYYRRLDVTFEPLSACSAP